MKTIIKEKYLYDSNKMLAGRNKKYGIKRPCMKRIRFIHGRFMFLYLVFTNHKLAKSD